MRAPPRPVWSEGMFMSPQHLQGLDRYHEGLLGTRLGSIAAHTWGSLCVDVDPAALGTGQFRVQRFDGVLPDGTPLSFEENDPQAPAPRSVAEHFPPNARTLEVYLAIPRERDGVATFAEDASQTRSRYAIASRPIEDATLVGASISVNFAQPNIAILFGDESREDYESMMIAEVIRGASGQLELSQDYIPPCLKISASPYLVSGVRDVLTRMISKQRQLSEGRQERDSTSIEITAPDVTRMLQLLCLAGAIPPLKHLAETAEASPLSAYERLAGLAGQLTTFVPGADPSDLPKFAYTDLRSTFRELFARLDELLGGLAQEQYMVVPLELRGTNLHVAAFHDDRLLRACQLFLCVKSQIPEQDVMGQVPRLSKIASSVDIEGLMHATVSGLPLQLTHRPPPQIPIRPGNVYFALVPTNDRYWQSVLTDRTLAIYLPRPFDPSQTQLELLAVPMAGAQMLQRSAPTPAPFPMAPRAPTPAPLPPRAPTPAPSLPSVTMPVAVVPAAPPPAPPEPSRQTSSTPRQTVPGRGPVK
jgi:type VI secretion system protein ImpJ